MDFYNNSVPADGLPSVSIDSATNRMTTASGWLYDLTGNLIRGQNASGVWQRFEYDAAGRLVKIKNDSNTELETYTYGATRERLITTTSTQRTYYAWGGSSVICEYTEPIASSTPAYAKSYQYAGSRLLSTSTKASSTTETTEFHHPDRLGTKLVTNGGSGSWYQQSTLPFGTAFNAESGGYSNQVFTSYDRSAGTGLDYAVNRTYSSGQSRFTQVDPIGMAAASIGNPQSNNLYAYVQNMPTDFVDPSGLNMECGFRTLIITMCIEGEGCSIVGTETIFVCSGSSGGGGTGPWPGDTGGGGGRRPPTTTTTTSGPPCLPSSPKVTKALGVTNDSIGGTGNGMKQTGGTIRFTNGLNNGSQFSPRHYPSDWGGGSRARISTYSMTGVGGAISRGSNVASGFTAAYDIGSNAYQEGGFGRNTQVAAGRGVGGIAGSVGGAKGGAIAGAALGVWFGVGGALPGAIIGGIIGGVGGGMGGSHVGGEVVRGIQDRNLPRGGRRCP